MCDNSPFRDLEPRYMMCMHASTRAGHMMIMLRLAISLVTHMLVHTLNILRAMHFKLQCAYVAVLSLRILAPSLSCTSVSALMH